MNPALQTAQWLAWRDPFYYVPLVGDVLRRVWLPVGSHEAINLDFPKRGAHFYVAMACAHQHTRVEYARVLATLREVGGHEAKATFTVAQDMRHTLRPSKFNNACTYLVLV